MRFSPAEKQDSGQTVWRMDSIIEMAQQTELGMERFQHPDLQRDRAKQKRRR